MHIKKKKPKKTACDDVNVSLYTCNIIYVRKLLTLFAEKEN